MNRPQPTTGSPAPVFPALDLPARQVSAWVVETDPETARSWLAGVTLAESSDGAQQLYQALYTLNRMVIPVEDRLALMELYREPVAAVADRMQAHFTHLALPLKPRLQGLADFLGQLHMEMAYGYKHVLSALRGERHPWGSEVFVFALERSIRYLGEVLLQSYQVYRPAPAGVWREIHGLYRYASDHGCHRQVIAPDAASIETAYLQVLMLGLCGPYQLPVNECRRVNGFLAHWAGKAIIRNEPAVADASGHFLLDLDADHPAAPCPRDVPLCVAPALRMVNAVELARVAYDFIQRLQKGESPKRMDLGFECVGNACRDTLRRMLRSWGLAGRRQFTRRRVRQSLSLCIGLNAFHFFAAGQQPFAPPRRSVQYVTPAKNSSELRVLDIEVADAGVAQPSAPEIYRIDSRWQVRDESAGGLSLTRHGSAGLPVRVGDLAGVQDPVRNTWRPAVVRWLKSGDSQHVEAGIEMLAPSAHPLAARLLEPATSTYQQALWVPPIEVLHQPATLLLSSSMNVQPGQGLELDDAGERRRVRVLSVTERTSAFVQVVFADEHH